MPSDFVAIAKRHVATGAFPFALPLEAPDLLLEVDFISLTTRGVDFSWPSSNGVDEWGLKLHRLIPYRVTVLMAGWG